MVYPYSNFERSGLEGETRLIFEDAAESGLLSLDPTLTVFDALGQDLRDRIVQAHNHDLSGKN